MRFGADWTVFTAEKSTVRLSTKVCKFAIIFVGPYLKLMKENDWRRSFHFWLLTISISLEIVSISFSFIVLINVTSLGYTIKCPVVVL